MVQYQVDSDLRMSFSEEESFQDTGTASNREDDIEKIDYIFVKTGKSKAPGVLHTHGSHFKFFKHGQSKDGNLFYYNCCEKKAHGCLARAIVEVDYPDGAEGDPVPVRLIEVAPPEFHAKWHCADNSKFIAHQILQVMKAEVEKNPTNKIGECFFD